MEKRKLYRGISVIVGAMLLFELYSRTRVLIIILDTSREFPLLWVLQILICIYGLLGITLMLASAFKRTSLFRSYCILIIGDFPATVWYQKSTYFDSHVISISGWFYFSGFLELLLLSCCCIMLWKLTRERRTKFSYTVFADEKFAEFSPVMAGKRLAHYVVDSAAMIYLAYNFIKLAEYVMLHQRSYGYDSYFSHRQQTFFTAELIGLIIFVSYYIVFEVVFRTTAGKCLTNTIIVNDRGENVGIGQLIGRTFCRLIPFDPLSFFAKSKRGWHDKITETYVVDSVLEGRKEKGERDEADILSAEDTGVMMAHNN